MAVSPYGDTAMQGNQPIDNNASDGKAKATRKAKPKPINEGKGKRSINLSLPMEDYERFALHALKLTNAISRS
jgi:hypothetical protein